MKLINTFILLIISFSCFSQQTLGDFRIINSDNFDSSTYSTAMGIYSSAKFTHNSIIEGSFSHIFGGEGCIIKSDSIYCVCDYEGNCSTEYKINFAPTDTVKIEGVDGIWVIHQNLTSLGYVIHNDCGLAYYCQEIKKTKKSINYIYGLGKQRWFPEQKLTKIQY